MEQGTVTKYVFKLNRDSEAKFLLKNILCSGMFCSYNDMFFVLAMQGVARNALLKLIHENSSSMRNNLYGSKIIACLEKTKNNVMWSLNC